MNIEVEVVVAILTSLTAVALSIFNMLFTYKVKKENNIENLRNQKELETFRSMLPAFNNAKRDLIDSHLSLLFELLGRVNKVILGGKSNKDEFIIKLEGLNKNLNTFVMSNKHVLSCDHFLCEKMEFIESNLVIFIEKLNLGSDRKMIFTVASICDAITAISNSEIIHE